VFYGYIVLGGIWLAPAAIAAALTIAERNRNWKRNMHRREGFFDWGTALGLLVCLLWPIGLFLCLVCLASMCLVALLGMKKRGRSTVAFLRT